MQLYWSISHTFCFMTFDLRGQIWTLGLKKFQNPITLELCKISTPNFVCKSIGQFSTHFVWPPPQPCHGPFQNITFDLRVQIFIKFCNVIWQKNLLIPNHPSSYYCFVLYFSAPYERLCSCIITFQFDNNPFYKSIFLV